MILRAEFDSAIVAVLTAASAKAITFENREITKAQIGMSLNTPPASVKFVDTALRNELLSHCIRTVKAARVERDPFPHFGATEIFPADFYQELVENLPDVDQYEAFSCQKHHAADGECNRLRCQFSNASLERLSEKKRRLWFTVRSVLGSAGFKRAVYEKLAVGLSLRFRNLRTDASDAPGYALPELFRETEGYVIKPHPDTRKKVVTMQLTLASDDSQRDLGTEFYKRTLSPQSWRSQPRGFEVTKKMPFTPNTVYAFSVLNTIALKSWHGRSAISGDFGVRNSILNIWYEKAEHANRELIEDAEWLAEEEYQSLQAA